MPKLLDRKQSADNESDDLNPGQKGYDELFPAKSLSEAEQDAVDNLEDSYDAPAIEDEDRNTRSPEDDRTDLVDKENPDSMPQQPESMYKGSEQPSAQKQKSTGSRLRGLAKNLMNNRGATGGIFALIFGGFGATSILTAPMTILNNLNSIVGNHTDLGNRLYGKAGNSFVAAFLSGDDRNCERSKIKCKFASISESRKAKWEARGIKVISENSKIIPGRVIVRGLEFPNGRKVTTLRQYANLRFTDPTMNSLLKRFPIRATYTNAKNATGKALGNFGTSLADKFRSSSAKEKKDRKAENAKTMNAKTGAVVDENGKTTLAGIQGKDKESGGKKILDRLKTPGKTLNVVGSATTGVATATVGACLVYNVIRAAQATVVLLWHGELIKFATPFLQAGSESKEAGVNGGFTWETAEYYGDRLTEPVTQADIDADPDDTITQDMLGKTAMDSKGMAAALNGDPVMNSDYSGWSPISNVWGAGTLQEVQDTLGGPTAVHNTCTVAQYGLLLSSASCLQKLVACAGALIAYQFVLQTFGDEIFEEAIDAVSEPAIKAIAAANLSDSLVGPALGDAVVGGAGVLASYADRAGGFPFAGSETQAFTAYMDTINDSEYLEEKIAEDKEAAKKNQFDISNRFSFAGQVSTQIASAPMDGSLFSVFKNLANTLSTIPLSAKASAMKQGLYQPIEVYQSPEKFNAALKNCTNPGMAELNAPCLGESGRTIPIMLPPVTTCLEEEKKLEKPQDSQLCINKAVDYLSTIKYGEGDEDEKKPYIDFNTGKPSDFGDYSKDKQDYKNPFLMYMRHCGNDRVFPIGYTDQPIDEPNYPWYVGSKCGATDGDNTELAWMSFYYTECIALYASEEDQDYCWDDAPATPVASVGVVGGKWTYPTTCEPQFTSGFGPRWGTVHQGVDLAGPVGTPIFAANDGKVVQAGPASGFGNWIVLEHEIDGQKWGSVYGHMYNDGVLVKEGDTVKAGQQIGAIGNNGQSTGAHLHFEIWQGGRFGGAAVDPWPFIEGEKKCA